MGAKQKADAKQELAAKRRQATQAERRIEELDRLFKRIYEDNANGKLSDSRFQMLSDDYEQEQEELREKLLQLNEEITPVSYTHLLNSYLVPPCLYQGAM